MKCKKSWKPAWLECCVEGEGRGQSVRLWSGVGYWWRRNRGLNGAVMGSTWAGGQGQCFDEVNRPAQLRETAEMHGPANMASSAMILINHTISTTKIQDRSAWRECWRDNVDGWPRTDVDCPLGRACLDTRNQKPGNWRINENEEHCNSIVRIDRVQFPWLRMLRRHTMTLYSYNIASRDTLWPNGCGVFLQWLPPLIVPRPRNLLSLKAFWSNLPLRTNLDIFLLLPFVVRPLISLAWQWLR